jgi:hypothetical protein
MMAAMLTLILIGLSRVVRTHRALMLETLALRHQLAVLQTHRAASTPAPFRPLVLDPEGYTYSKSALRAIDR